jgi:hypothetical protein
MIKTSKFKNIPPLLHHAGDVYALLMIQMRRQMHTSGLESVYKQRCLWYTEKWDRLYVQRIMIDWLHLSYLALTLLNFDKPVRRDSSVGKATHSTNGVDVPGIESRWEKDFPYPFKLALGPTQQEVPGHFRGVKRPGRGVHYPPHLESRLKSRAIPDSPSGLSWPVLGF